MTYEPDLREELDTCLEVLVEQADRLVARREAGINRYQRRWGSAVVTVPPSLLTENDEQITTLYQTTELVLLLLTENEQAWEAIHGLRKALHTMQQKGRDLWTPTG